MLARLQRFIVVALIASSLAWGTWLMKLGRPGWAWAGVALILLGYALFLGIEFVMLLFVRGQGRVPRPSTSQLLRAWCGEVLVAPRVFFWHQPFRSNAEPDNVGLGAGGRRGVVLVHGFVCNRGLWNPWMRELRARGVPFVAVNLEPLFGSIDHYPQVVEAAVSRVEAATGMPVLLVGHSMGGLAIRAWLAKFAADARVTRVITIGSPHRGTWLARYGHTINGKQMRQSNPWLAQLAAQEDARRRARFTCFFGHCDNIVFPAESGTLDGAENRHIPATAHVHMAFQDVVFNEAWRWLAPGIAAPRSTPHAPAALAR